MKARSLFPPATAGGVDSVLILFEHTLTQITPAQVGGVTGHRAGIIAGNADRTASSM
jgi:hypothetical protein